MKTLRFLYLVFLTNFKRSLALRTTFVITIIVVILKQLLFLVGWKFFFDKYKVINGWNFEEMLMMYGVIGFSLGTIECLFYGLKDLPRMIESTQLDSFLLQPKNVILNVALSKSDLGSLGEIITGILLMSYSGYLLKSAFVPVILLLGVLFIFSLTLYLACIAFYMRDAYEFIRELSLNAIITASQPNVAYTGAFKMLTFTILPVAFLSYFPIEYLRTHYWPYLAYSFIGTLAFFWLATSLFYRGLKRYESGNKLGFMQ